MKKTLLTALLLLALALNLGAGLRDPGDSSTTDEVQALTPNLVPEDLGPGPEIITTGPGNDALYEKAAAYTGGESLSARLRDPERYESSFSNKDGTLTVEADAKVVIPDADAAPLIRVTSGSVTQEQADTLMDALVHCTLYELTNEHSKDEYAQKIAEVEQRLAELGVPEEQIQAAAPPDDSDPDGPAVEGYSTVEDWLLDHLKSYREQLATAPETVERTPISGQFEPEPGGGMTIAGEGESEEYGTEYFSVSMGPGVGNARANYVRGDYSANPRDYELARNADQCPWGQVDPDSIEDPTCTAEDARALCDPIVEALDIEGMTLYSAQKKYGGAATYGGRARCCWVLQYTRAPEGLPVTYTRTDGDVMTDAPVYQLNWVYEKLTFYVDDSGIVGLWWEAPYDLGEHVTEDAALLPFDEAMAVFEKMFPVAYDNDGLPFDVSFPLRTARWDGKAVHVQVSEVRLGYTRIAEMDKEKTGLLVPAWDFFGVVTDGDGNVLLDDPEASLLTVNAVDGDVIDRGFGY